MSASEIVTVWDYSDNAPEWAEPLAACWSWSLNCDPAGNPFTALLDLVGFSEDEFGGRLFPWAGRDDYDRRTHRFTRRDWSLGWVEVGKLADALALWADRPYDCAEWVRGLFACED